MPESRHQNHDKHHGGGGNYWRFIAMVATSTAVMFGLMYLNSYAADHAFWSQTRFWMAFVMGGAMLIVMLLFMWGMYKDKTRNFVLLGVGALIFAIALWLVRSQATIDDESYMSAMIPHHSIAVLTSSRAEITDPRVRKLADSIIEAQVKEIAEMKLLLEDIEQNGEMGDGTALPARTTKLTPKLFEEAAQEIERPLTPEVREAVTVDE